MRHDYSIRADGRAYWYTDAWGSLMFDWDPMGLSAKNVADLKRSLHVVPSLQNSVAKAERDLQEGVRRVLLHEAPARGRSTGVYRFVLPRGRKKIACQRVKNWLEAQGVIVTTRPGWIGGGAHGGWVYYDVFGSIRFFSEMVGDVDGKPAFYLDTNPKRKWSSGIYSLFIPKWRRDAAIRHIVEYAERLGWRAVFEY